MFSLSAGEEEEEEDGPVLLVKTPPKAVLRSFVFLLPCRRGVSGAFLAVSGLPADSYLSSGIFRSLFAESKPP